MSCRYHSTRRRRSRRDLARGRGPRKRASCAAGSGGSSLDQPFDAVINVVGINAPVEETLQERVESLRFLASEGSERVLLRVALARPVANPALSFDRGAGEVACHFRE